MKLLLIRGLPGSGKSTLAKNLIGWYWHIETDKFWIVDGEYKFDYTRLGEAHQWCLNNTRDMMKHGYSPVVSNTFTTKKELKPYFDLAKEFDIIPTVIVCQSNWGNIHNVPEEKLKQMADRFEFDIGELYE